MKHSLKLYYTCFREEKFPGTRTLDVKSLQDFISTFELIVILNLNN